MQRGSLALEVADLLLDPQALLVQRQGPLQITTRDAQVGQFVAQAARHPGRLGVPLRVGQRLAWWQDAFQQVVGRFGLTVSPLQPGQPPNVPQPLITLQAVSGGVQRIQ